MSTISKKPLPTERRSIRLDAEVWKRIQALKDEYRTVNEGLRELLKVKREVIK
jgi:predicted CopG family antitoxin